VGIVIDDAIVVLENIVKFIEEKGYPPRRAAIYATKEIGLAVLATTISLVAVFLPVAFMGGIVGRFMKSFGFTMSFSIMVSLLVSFTLTPMLASRWLRPSSKSRAGVGRASIEPEEHEEKESLDAEFADPAPEPRDVEKQSYREWRRGERAIPEGYTGAHGGSRGVYGVIEGAYTKLLAFAMGHRWVVGLAMIGAIASLVPLGKAVQKNFLPLDDESRFEVTIRAPEGTSLVQTQVISDRIARSIRTVPGVAYTVTTVGSAAGDISGRGANEASIFVSLIDPTRRSLNQYQMMDRIRQQILPRFSHENLRALVTPVNVFGGSGAASAGIQYVIRGPDIDRLAEYSQRL
jgi:HAE1 family hydrophobic/amphiphilic exporter-1